VVLLGFKGPKSLGPNIWPMEFYLDFFDLLVDEIIRCYKNQESQEAFMGPLIQRLFL
jgi:hypothetical protein